MSQFTELQGRQSWPVLYLLLANQYTLASLHNTHLLTMLQYLGLSSTLTIAKWDTYLVTSHPIDIYLPSDTYPPLRSDTYPSGDTYPPHR